MASVRLNAGSQGEVGASVHLHGVIIPHGMMPPMINQIVMPQREKSGLCWAVCVISHGPWCGFNQILSPMIRVHYGNSVLKDTYTRISIHTRSEVHSKRQLLQNLD